MGNVYTASYWVPVYFQGVKGSSPTMAGVYMLPMIIAHVIAALSSNQIGMYVLSFEYPTLTYVGQLMQ